MGFSSGMSMPFSLDPCVGSMAAAIARDLERQSEVAEARKEFVVSRVAELVDGDSDSLAIAAHYALTVHRTAFGVALKRLMEDGTVEAILAMDALLRNAAEDIAQAEWLSGKEHE